jgi:methyl-accepting chemotaxis protein
VSVKTRLVVSTTVVLAVALAGLVTVIATLTTKQARADGLRYASSLAAAQAQEVETGLTRQMGTAQTLGRTLGVLTGAGQGDRDAVDAIERDLLAADPSLLAVWSAFEPDAFDGQDSEHVTDPTSDVSCGRPSSWVRS